VYYQILDILERNQLLTKDHSELIKKISQEQGLHLIEVCEKELNLDQVTICQVIAEALGIPLLESEDLELDTSLIESIPKTVAKKYGVVPLAKHQKYLEIGMLDPTNLASINDIKFITGQEIQVKMITPSQFSRFFEKLYEDQQLNKIISDIKDEHAQVEVAEEQAINISELEKESESAPIIKLVNAILIDAIRKRASDIHFEPFEKNCRVRFRIDGILYEIMRPPAKLKNSISTRLKIMANLDIAERRLPQDGRIKLRLGHREVDFRVNVIPTIYGEKVVLRLLDKSNLQLNLDSLGFEAHQKELFLSAISKPYGLVLVVGPTGSGKTTTLYSALLELNKPHVNISTIEDPVEYQLNGINQIQVNEEIGLTFASCLRAFLRQDPDVILVGEIRDLETAEIAVKASLTGHLVLSTLHTNDSTSTITRLLNMGVEPFLVSTSLNLIVAQRLVRKVCSSCAEPLNVHPETLLQLGFSESELDYVRPIKGVGCKNCSNTGYSGRVAIYEVLDVNDELKDLVLSGVNANELRRHAKRLGLQTLRRSALNKVREGLTSLDEVVRVTIND